MNKKKGLSISILGNVIDYYDLGLVGFFSPILAELFFPTDKPILSTLATFGTFAIGFIARPLGALILGHYGDKIGRKKVLLSSILLMCIPSTLIGFLPSYNDVGIIAPIALIICRFFQGVFTGGVYNGAAIFYIEHNSHSDQKGYYTSLISASAIMGFFMASIVAYICTQPWMPPNSWRLAFFLGGLLGLIVWYIRKQISETPEFESIKENKKIHRLPIKEVLLNEPISSLCMIGFGGCVGCMSLTLVGLSGFLTKVLFVPATVASFSNMIGICFYMILTPIMGKLIDKFGADKLMQAVAIASIFSVYPIFCLIINKTLFSLIVGQILLAVLASGLLSTAHILTFSIFSPNNRYTGISFNFSLGLAIFGGCAPLFTSLLGQYFSITLGPSLYLILTSFIGLFSLRLSKAHKKKQIYTRENLINKSYAH